MGIQSLDTNFIVQKTQLSFCANMKSCIAFSPKIQNLSYFDSQMDIFTRRYVMATYVEGFSHYGAFQPKVKLLSCLVDEQGWDCVHFKQVRPSRKVNISTWGRKSLLVLCVDEDVKPKQVVVVVETPNAFLDHVVNVLVAAQDGFDHNILHPAPERFRVLTSFSQPSPQLVHRPLVILAKDNLDDVSYPGKK